ncbi:MAG: adenylate/guanylate cyclase domain-containing protein [Salibacteraceae bacterium]
MFKHQFQPIALLYLRLILVWIVATLFFNFLRNYGVDPEANIPLKILTIEQVLAINLLFGCLAGLVYTSVELLFDRSYFQQYSYLKILLGKLLLFFFGVKLCMGVGIALALALNSDLVETVDPIEVLRSKRYWVIFSYFIVVASTISFIRMVSYKFGPGMLWNMFIGRYRNPREEQRVFMFLDLRASTTLAEKLGHLQFSSLIQNCFADLTPVIAKHNVEIYQYVGDEAVLSWSMPSGLAENHCIHAYFDFMEVLRNRSEHYEQAFGLQPFFKAGLHLGNVIVAEVGLVKRVIAYHGDVLNTTARIQSRCNELNEALLVSGQLLSYLQPDDRIQTTYLGEEVLKGKKSAIHLHGIRKSRK